MFLLQTTWCALFFQARAPRAALHVACLIVLWARHHLRDFGVAYAAWTIYAFLLNAVAVLRDLSRSLGRRC